MTIATRLLKLRDIDSDTEIAIRIFAPEETKSGWNCRYEIDWPEGKETMSASGIDSVQALVLALQMIGADIYSSSYHKSGKLVFDAPGRGYGFPVPSSLRDVLVGDDRIYGA
jgi:hypothetical protein